MTIKAYRDKIVEACKSLGVYRIEFTRTRDRLARTYLRIEQLTNAIGDRFPELAEMESPMIKELNRQYEQALSCEKALGLTAESARKINENVFAPEVVDPFARTLSLLRKKA